MRVGMGFVLSGRDTPQVLVDNVDRTADTRGMTQTAATEPQGIYRAPAPIFMAWWIWHTLRTTRPMYRPAA
jgi:hypothetical protein